MLLLLELLLPIGVLSGAAIAGLLWWSSQLGSPASRGLLPAPPEGSGDSTDHPIQGSSMVWRAVPEGIALGYPASRPGEPSPPRLVLTPSAAWHGSQKTPVWGYRFQHQDMRSLSRFTLLGVQEDGTTVTLFQADCEFRGGWLAFRDALRSRGLLGPAQIAGAVEDVPPELRQGFPHRLR